MFLEIIKNPVVLSVALLLILSAMRLNVVFALIISSLIGGISAGLGSAETMKAFLGSGLANGAQLAFNYAMLGAFSIAISYSGLTELLAQALFKRIGGWEIHQITERSIAFQFFDGVDCRKSVKQRVAGHQHEWLKRNFLRNDTVVFLPDPDGRMIVAGFQGGDTLYSGWDQIA